MEAALKRKVNLLIQLALADGELDIRERSFIYNVCIRNGVDLDTIGDMIDQPEPIGDLSSLPIPARVDYLTDCLTLTLIDGKVLPKEVALVMNVAQQIGIRQPDMENLIETIQSNMNVTPEELRTRVTEIVKA